MEGPESRDLVLVDQQVLPEVFVRVLEAKRSLLSGEASSAAEAARRAGLSRSAFYKYKDAVFPYDAGRTGYILTVHSVLRDRPGVLSSMLAAFADAGANILTVNQNIPAGARRRSPSPLEPTGWKCRWMPSCGPWGSCRGWTGSPGYPMN